MKQLSDLIGHKVTIIVKDYNDFEGILQSINNGGYYLKEKNGSEYFIPEANNVIYVMSGYKDEDE